MKEFCAYFKAKFYDDSIPSDNKLVTECGAFPCDDFAEAMKNIEDFYGNMLASIEITLVDDCFVSISEENYNEMIKKVV